MNRDNVKTTGAQQFTTVSSANGIVGVTKKLDGTDPGFQLLHLCEHKN